MSTYRFSLRFLFILVGIAAIGCLLTRAAISVPILAIVCVFYLPLFAMYAILRGPYLYHRWKGFQQQFNAIREERRALIHDAVNREQRGGDKDVSSNWQ